MNKPKYTADSIEEFQKLVDFYNSLHNTLQENINALSYSIIGKFHVHMNLCDHPSRRGEKAVYLPEKTVTTSYDLQGDTLSFIGDNFVFDVNLKGETKFSILHSIWV